MTLTEVTDEVTSTGFIAATSILHGLSDSEGGICSSREDLIETTPIFKAGETVQFVPDRMQIDRPYLFRFMEWWFIAKKRTDGALDFFHIAGGGE